MKVWSLRTTGAAAALAALAALTGLVNAPAHAAEGSVEATYFDCNYDPDTNTMRPVATIHRYPGADSGDNRVSTVMWLLDGTTQIDSLSAGELSIDGSLADNGLIDLAPDKTMAVTPWGSYFGDTGRAGSATLQTNHTYKVRVRNFEFSSGEQTLRTFTCKTVDDYSAKCTGISMEQTAFRPAYVTKKSLAGFRNNTAMCEAYWMPNAATGFVPQGLALDGNTAWVSGYRQNNAWIVESGPDKNPKGERCVVVHVSLAGGTQIGDLLTVSTPDQQSWCQHGGGAAMIPQGLLVVSTKNLWLVDPSKTGPAAYLRHWQLGGIKGSFLVESVNGRIGIGQFNDAKSDTIKMYRTADIMKDGVELILGFGPPAPNEASPVGTAEAVTFAQGADFKPGTSTLYTSASTAKCGQLVRNASKRLGFGAGSEEIEFDPAGDHLWAVFEASAKQFYDKDRPVTPMLARFDTAKLTGPDAKAPDCTP